MDMNFQLIGDILSGILPEGWEKVRLFCEISPASYEFFFHVKLNGKYVQNFDLEATHNISHKEMRSVFNQLYNEMKADQAKENWKVATFTMDNSGAFKVDFDYDVSEVTLEYKNKWMEDFLD